MIILMRRISRIITYAVFFLVPISALPQEIVNYIQDNPAAEKYYSEYSNARKSVQSSDTVELPFLDDFSDSDIEPKQSLWSDNFAFVNNTFAIYPPSAGVVTLDALDYKGSQYPGANSSGYQADYLTSQPINLAYEPSDSIYLSFFYEPGGRGEPPEKGDSLILDFYSPDSLEWSTVWADPVGGQSSEFKYVMIKIDEPVYLKKGFRFRFRNIASQLPNPDRDDMKANVDVWHIDYINLDRNRLIEDTVIRDVAFIEPIRSILKDFTAVPWSHFESAFNTQRAPYIGVIIDNHDTVSRNVGTYLEIRDLINGKATYKIPALYNDIEAGDSMHYQYSYNYLFDFEKGDSAAFEIKTILQTSPFDYKQNDTLRHIQEFYDYYALDDGTAEASYGMRGAGTKDASSALKYNSFRGDSLRAIDIYFAKLVDNVNLSYFFYLNVWKDNNGKPGTRVVDQINNQPHYTDTLNKFYRYYLTEPVFIEGTFYIGFTQVAEKLLNVGLDMNRSNQARIFNNLDNGNWNTTTVIPGTPMMRPVFHTDPYTAVPVVDAEPSFEIYPLPANETINISTDERFISAGSYFDLYDIRGRMIAKVNAESLTVIPASDLPDGLYVLRFLNPGTGTGSTRKIIILH
jgi:hypothetical protein